MVAVTVGIVLLSGFLFTKIDKGFIPSQDMSMFRLTIQADDRASFDYVTQHQDQLNRILEKEAGLKGALSVVGYSSYNSGLVLVSLKDRKDRTESVDQIINRLRPEFNNIPGIKVYPYNPPPISMGSRQTAGIGQFTITSPDLDLLAKAATDMEDQMRSIPGLTDV